MGAWRLPWVLSPGFPRHWPPVSELLPSWDDGGASMHLSRLFLVSPMDAAAELAVLSQSTRGAALTGAAARFFSTAGSGWQAVHCFQTV